MSQPIAGMNALRPVRLGLRSGAALGRRRNLLRISFFGLLIAATFVASLVFASREQTHLDFWLSLIGFGALLLYLVMFEWPSDPLTPLVPVIFIYLVTFYGRSLLLYYDYRSDFTNGIVTQNIDLLDRAMVYVTLGVAAYVLVYLSPIPRFVASHFDSKPLNLSPRELEGKARRLFWIGLPFGLVHSARAFSAQWKTLALIALMLSFLAQIGFFIYTMLASDPATKHVTDRKTLITMFAALAVIAMMTGYRESLVTVIFVFLAARHYSGHRITIPKMLVFVFFIVFVISPVEMAYRALTWDAGVNLLDAFQKVPSMIVELVQAFAGTDVTGPTFIGYYFAQFWVAIAFRFHGIDSLIAVMARVPTFMDYTHGSTIFFLPVSALVPRFLWPGKPDTGLGDYFRENFWSGSTGGAIAISQPAELYLNFGLAGIILGMAVLAIVHGGVYEYFRKTRTHASLILLVFSLPSFFSVERDVSLVYASLFKLYLLLFCVIKYLHHGNPQEHTGTRPRPRRIVPRPEAETISG